MVDIINPIIISTAVTVLGAGVFKFASWLKGYSIELSNRKDLYNSLFSFLNDCDLSLGTINPWIENTIPPDDKEASVAFYSIIKKYFHKNSKESFIWNTICPDLNKNICSLGGPISHNLTRRGMGYNNKWELKNPFLPYKFELDQKKLEFPKYKVKRLSGDKVWYEPNYCIVNTSSREQVYTPSVKNNELQNDYLMIIVKKNNFTKQAERYGKKHMMIAGTHGVANKAINIVMADTKIINEIYNECQSGFFQAIIEIPEVEYGAIPKGKPIVREIKEL